MMRYFLYLSYSVVPKGESSYAWHHAQYRSYAEAEKEGKEILERASQVEKVQIFELNAELTRGVVVERQGLGS